MNRISLAKIRAALAAEAETHGLRHTAREVKLSPTGLRKFLGGTREHERTRRKAEAWWVRHTAAAHPAVVDPVTAGAALDLLTAGMPAANRETLVVGFLALASNEYRRAELSVPEWVEAIAA